MLILVDNLVSSNNEVAMHPEDKETDDQAVVVDDLAIDDGRKYDIFQMDKGSIRIHGQMIQLGRHDRDEEYICCPYVQHHSYLYII